MGMLGSEAFDGPDLPSAKGTRVPTLTREGDDMRDDREGSPALPNPKPQD